MRPTGEIRRTIITAVREHGAMPLRDIAVRAQVGYAATRWTLVRCVAAGELVIAGHERRAHCTDAVALYDVPQPGDAAYPSPPSCDHDGGLVLLAGALDSWR